MLWLSMQLFRLSKQYEMYVEKNKHEANERGNVVFI